MWKMKEFWENNRIYLRAMGVLLLFLLGTGLLYEINQEFLGYELAFVVLISLLACAFQYRKMQKEAEKNRKEPKTGLVENQEREWETLREKEDFFALWTHQIKTPIAALQLLFQDENPNLFACKNELFKIENYVEMALNYLRYEEVSQDLLLERCQLEPIVKQLVKKYSTIFIHQHLTVELENLSVEILTDEKWFSFILEQILSNALKYTKKGGIKIYAQDSENGTKIGIKDSGVGIKSEDLPRVFEKGYTGYNGRIDKKASGIGLFLCKGVCDKLGHQIRIESELGKGTEVLLFLPKEQLEMSNLTKM